MKLPFLPLVLMLTFSLPGAADPRRTEAAGGRPSVSRSSALQSVLENAVDEALRQFAHRQLRRDQIAVTLVDISTPGLPQSAAHRGQEPIYPASVIKLFYMFATHHWLEEGRLPDTPELRRALRDMIVHSYNEATHYIVDLLTDTTSGPELSDIELELWQEKRNAVNRYFASLGYREINVNKKPWHEGPYGRESQAVQRFAPNRNWLTTDATAQLMMDLFLNYGLPPHHCAAMRELLLREPHAPAAEIDPQARFTGPGLPQGSRLWSKAGWTSQTRHDAACIELPNGRKLILVTFTVDHAEDPNIIPTIAREVLEHLP